jgi:predicted nucleotidyltransferase component of viral defense system
MLNLDQIAGYYPEKLRYFPKNMLREYLQHKILEIIFNSKFAGKLSFLGGTALRIFYINSRFSEDLDFDNLGLGKEDFSALASHIEKELSKQGYQVETRNVFKGVFRCYIKLPKILFDNKLSDMADEKILIQVDVAPHDFTYTPERLILNKFDIFTEVHVTPPDILLAQKIYAALNRKRAKGRDFFDIIFLLQNNKPNYEYLNKKIDIDNASDLKKKLIESFAKVNFNEMAKDVEPFLFDPSDSRKIKNFMAFIKQTTF